MNYYNKILNYLFPIWILVSINYSQDFSIDLTLLNTGQFTLNSWNNVEELWYIEVLNNSSEEVGYKLKFKLYQGINQNLELLVEGHTEPLSINSGENIIYHNLNPVFDQSNLSYYNEANPEFISIIVNQLGYLPPGHYKLELIAVDLDGGAILSSYEEEIEFTVGDQFSIEYPNDGQVFAGGGSFYYQWYTPGFRQGVNIEFRIIISAIISEEVDSPEDAIELGSNAVFYFDSNWDNLPISFSGDWPYVESGYSNLLNFWYFTLISETGMPQLECGFDYAWRMDAREVIDGFESDSGDQGLWGWPEPVHSVVRKFTWGENPSGLVSPVGDDVLPLFMWDNIGCAEDGFDIQISPIEDEDFTDSWEADFIFSPFKYSADAPGLIPGKSYKWRVRVHSLTGNTNWSQIETFTIQDIELLSLFNGLIPEDFSIHSIYPNPFNPVTKITYGLPENTEIQIIIYDMGGTQVTSLVNTFQTAGYHTINWDASSFPSGVYLIRMDSGDFTQTQKVVLVK